MNKMPNRPWIIVYLLVYSFLPLSEGIFLAPSSAEAQSNREVRVAIDHLRETLEVTTRRLRLSEKSSTTDLKSDLLESLTRLHGALTQAVVALDTIQVQQDKKIDGNQLYCIFFPGNEFAATRIDFCYLANNPTNRFSKTLNEIQEEGWHLTSTGGASIPSILAVYSKYIE